MQGFQPRIFICIWYRSHATTVTCLLIAAKSFKLMSGFQVKVSFSLSNGQQKGQAQSIQDCSLMRLLTLCWSSGEITNMLAFTFKAKSLPNRTLYKFNSFDSLLAESQEHHSLWDVIPMLCFAPVPKVLFLESEISIPATCHTYRKHWQHVMNCS